MSLVLASLRQAPFEPLQSASIDILTWKTAFLIALASGKRRSEIHAIERSSISWTETRDRVTLRVNPSFVAKTQIAENVRAVQPIMIDSLRGFIDDSPEDLLLCPVRALFLYLDRTKQLNLVKSKKKLFVSYKVGRDKEILKVTISNWIKKAIVEAYSTANKSDLEYYKIKAHQVRALSASLAHFNQVPMEQVMDTCSWACHNTFTSFYLQNFSEEMNNGYRICHIVANQKVVSL